MAGVASERKPIVMFNGQPLTTYEAGGVRQTYTGIEYIARHYCPVEYLHTDASPGRLVRSSKLLSNGWSLLFCLLRVAGSNKIVFIDYSQRFTFALFSLLAKLLTGTRVVVQVQCTYFVLARAAAARAIDQVISRLLCRAADRVVVAGHTLRDEVVRWGVSPDKVRIIYPALRREFVGRPPRSACISRKEALHVLFVGRVTPIKGVEYLIQAAALLKAVPITITVVGPTQAGVDYLRMLDRLIQESGLQDQIHFLGSVQEVEALIRVYESSDIFVLPSLWDTSPIAVLEAMTLGLPIVATRVGAIPEWVEDGVNGILVPPRDAEGLALALEKLIRDPELRLRMGEASYERSLKYQARTWKDVGEEYWEAISGLRKRGQRSL